MTQLFGRFTSPASSVQFPGAAFVAASLLSATCFAIYYTTTRREQREVVAEPEPRPQDSEIGVT
jgi:hypothetical protein